MKSSRPGIEAGKAAFKVQVLQYQTTYSHIVSGRFTAIKQHWKVKGLAFGQISLQFMFAFLAPKLNIIIEAVI